MIEEFCLQAENWKECKRPEKYLMLWITTEWSGDSCNFCFTKTKRWSEQLLKLTMTNGKQSSKLILLQLHETLPKNSISTILSFVIWRKLERWKNSINGYLMSWSKIKEIIILKCHFLLFCETTMNHFWIGLWHVTKDSQRRPAQWLDREAPKHFPKPDCTQKRS